MASRDSAESHGVQGIGPIRSLSIGDPELDAILKSSDFDSAVNHAVQLAGLGSGSLGSGWGVGKPVALDDRTMGKAVRSRGFAHSLHEALATNEISDMSKVKVGKLGDAFVDDALMTDKLADGLDSSTPQNASKGHLSA